ncbi:hypothetical protein T265_01755 [Opisthorchis viverrini]|uniref:Uncharacterized protein n=1 Tax=Opisthorchis viverrini TaxID=6198 RepID=A0A075A8U1_OPIVI|nr:hypothetical protein T265_01755 [Opisthorchis viverrini]KER32135.1 hypothetical protein T265_01755 [Opisthorchis viverrini]
MNAKVCPGISAKYHGQQTMSTTGHTLNSHKLDSNFMREQSSYREAITSSALHSGAGAFCGSTKN